MTTATEKEPTKKEEKKEDPRPAIMKKLFKLAADKGIKLVRGSELKSFQYVSSGLPQIDALGGACIGRFTVIYGPEGSGKSTYLYRQIAAFQRTFPDKIPCLVDAEQRIEPTWMQAQGVDTENLAIIQGHKTMEEFCNAARQLACSGLISYIAIDTISAMKPAIMFQETNTEKNILNRDHVAKDAVKITQFIGLINADIFNNNVACIIVAQARTHGIGGRVTYLGLSGGYMLKHMATQIWQFMQLKSAGDVTYENITVDSKPVKVVTAFKIRALLEKDTGPNPRRVAILPFVVGVGFDDIESVIGSGLRFGCIEETGKARFRWVDTNGEEHKLHGRANVMDYFKAAPLEIERLKEAVAITHHKMAGTKTSDPEPIEEQVWVSEDDEEQS